MTVITFPTPYPPQAIPTPPQAVYTRVNWGDAWSGAGNLWCTRLALATAETISSATFQWRFGPHLAPGGIAWTTVPVLAVNPRAFVRVDVDGTGGRADFRWYGVWQRAEKGDNVQQFQAVGLEQLLDVPCIDTPYERGGAIKWAGRGIGFNVGGPNRGGKQTVNGQSVYVFSDDIACTDYWTTRDAVETLLAVGAPIDGNDNVIFNWTPQNLAALCNFDKPEIPTHGRTFLELLRSLVPRYRLTGWTVEPGTGAAVDVRFFTFAESSIDLKDSEGNTVGTIPANSTQDALIFTYDQSSRASLVTEASHVADQVIARGDRRQIVFTLSKLDGTIVKKWSDARQTAYITAASAALDYPGADEIRLREERERDARHVDELRSVFAWYGPPSDWDQTAGDGENGVTKEPIAVDAEDDQFFLYRPALALSPTVPHQIDSDRYDEDLPLLCFVRAVYAAVDPGGKDRWVFADQVARAADLEQTDDRNARQWSLAVRPLAEVVASALCIEARVDGDDQHAVAATEFSGRDDNVVGAVKWEEDLIWTVCIEDTRHLEARYPADEDLAPLGQLLNQLYLDCVGYRYVDLRPNTVTAIRNTDQQLVRSTGEVVVDDTDELLLIAQRTYQWHSVPRYALGFSTGWIDGAVKIGHLITQLTDATSTYPVRSVTTEITLEFPISESTTPQRPQLSLTTAFAEMDAQRVI